MRIQLPEQISLELPVANFGSRALAYMTDFAIRWCTLLFGLFLIVISSRYVAPVGTVVEFGLRKFGTKENRMLWLGLITLGVFLYEWGYTVYFEVFRGGVTPGKRYFGLRVVDENGLSMNLRASLLRTVFLIVDLLPAFGMVGCISMLVTKRNQRLGDLVAGTMVIYENVQEDALRGLHASSDEEPLLRLPLQHYTLLANYLQRQATLTDAVKEKMEHQLVAAIRSSLRARSGEIRQPETFESRMSWLNWIYANAQPLEVSYEHAPNGAETQPRGR